MDTVAKFASYDRIVAADTPERQGETVYLQVTDAGKLDLAKALEGQRAVSITASDKGNEIIAGAKDDTLYGGAGADTLRGGGGGDTLQDSNTYASDADLLVGGAGNDTITSLGGEDTIEGGAGDDRIALYDIGRRATIDGGEGRDVLAGAYDITRLTISNVEVLEAGSVVATAAQLAGFSRIVAYDNADYDTTAINVQLSGTGRIDLTTALEGKRAAYVTASDAGNEIVGGSKNDTLTGGAGNDVLTGGAGDDSLTGGAGEDVAVYARSYASYTLNPVRGTSDQFSVFGEGADTLAGIEIARFSDGTYDFRTGKFSSAEPKVLVTDGMTASGTVADFASYDAIRGSNNDPNAGISLKVTDGGALDLSARVGARPVTLEGSPAGNSFTTGSGNDRLLQTLDTLDKGATTTFKGGLGLDTAELSAGIGATGPLVAKVLSDGSVSFTMDGRTVVAGPDVERFVVTGSEKGDELVGGTGADWLNGKGGDDTFAGSSGNDGYVFDTAGDKVVGETANGSSDTIWSTVSVDLSRQGEVENLRLQGTGPIDGSGNALANTITGNAGANVISGGAGKDQLWGRGGSDVFVFAEKGAGNRDTILDFDADDAIRLDKGVFSGLDADQDGIVDKTALSLTGKADISGPQLVYSAKTGILSYDADGSGKGAAEEIAAIGKGLAFLDHADILLA